jgi:hypothetical protein
VNQGGPIRGKGRSLSKGDLKSSQLPVTDTTPYVCEPIPDGDFPDMVPVLDVLGSFMFFADEQLARSFVVKHQVRIFRTARKIRALQALTTLEDLPASLICSQNRYFGLPNRRETDTNPARVWTQDRMGNTIPSRGSNLMPIDDSRARFCRKVCFAVVTSCAKSAKKAA